MISLDESVPSEDQKLSPKDFRIAFKLAFQRELMRVFFAEVRALTGPGTLKELLGRLGVNVEDEVQLQCWYGRARGERFPRPDLLNELRAQMPGLKLDLHHPMLRLLTRGTLDERAVRRIKGRMPAVCEATAQIVQRLPTRELHASRALLDRLRLYRMSYLDALYVFVRARNVKTLDANKTTQLNRILWTLPILYADDPLWIGNRHEKAWILLLIDHALDLTGADSPGDHWKCQPREGLIFSQLWHAQQRVKRQPRALCTPMTRLRYWARPWRW